MNVIFICADNKCGKLEKKRRTVVITSWLKGACNSIPTQMIRTIKNNKLGGGNALDKTQDDFTNKIYDKNLSYTETNFFLSRRQRE